MTVPSLTSAHAGSLAILSAMTLRAAAESVVAVELTKWGVAASRFDDRSVSVSPVWNARQFSLRQQKSISTTTKVAVEG